MSENKKKSGLNLGAKKAVNTPPMGTPPPGAIDMTMEIMVSLQAIAGALEGVAIELQDLKDNSNRDLLDRKLITEVEIEERENQSDEPE